MTEGSDNSETGSMPSLPEMGTEMISVPSVSEKGTLMISSSVSKKGT